MDRTSDLPLRPGLFVEHKLITAVLDGSFPPGSSLPGERILAQRLGVTRPTLREGLHRLAGQGWFTISQGRPTRVNNFWEKGGMGLLGTLSRYPRFLSDKFITHLLEARATLLPSIARLAVRNEPGAVSEILDRQGALKEDPKAFVRFDWDLQISMARYSQNPVYTLIFNDFSTVYAVFGVRYFESREARRSSREFYREMYEDLRNGGGKIERIVQMAMEKSIDIWKSSKGG